MLTEIIKVARIEVKAGRCYKCHSFRYCHYQSELGEIICPDCVQTLINQQLLIIQSKPTRQRRSSQEKLIAVEPQKEVKPRAKYVSSIKKIQKLLEESKKALTVREIIESGVCGHKTSVYKTLDRLIETGAIVASSDTAKNRLFISKNRVHLLQVKRTIRRREAAQVNRNKVLDYIKKEGRILEVADVVAATDITKKTVIRIIISLGKAGDITLIRDSERGNRLHFVPSDNTELVAKLVELDQLSTANQVRKILQSSDKGMSIGDVMVAIGKGKRNGGSYKYIKKLFKQWGCKSYKQGCGLYYYLETGKPE
ncbi:MAG: hypothetical protein ACKPFK_31635 [Dolichospermum sp.]